MTDYDRLFTFISNYGSISVDFRANDDANFSVSTTFRTRPRGHAAPRGLAGWTASMGLPISVL